MNDDRRITPSSGNIFADLGVSNPEEAMARAQLLRRIKAIIAESSMTQTEVARVLGVDQPQVSKLVNGKLSVFSMDRLIHFLTALDRDVEIVVKPKERGHGRVLVTPA